MPPYGKKVKQISKKTINKLSINHKKYINISLKAYESNLCQFTVSIG